MPKRRVTVRIVRKNEKVRQRRKGIDQLERDLKIMQKRHLSVVARERKEF
jgi:hypothetical protein